MIGVIEGLSVELTVEAARWAARKLDPAQRRELRPLVRECLKQVVADVARMDADKRELRDAVRDVTNVADDDALLDALIVSALAGPAAKRVAQWEAELREALLKPTRAHLDTTKLNTVVDVQQLLTLAPARLWGAVETSTVST